MARFLYIETCGGHIIPFNESNRQSYIDWTHRLTKAELGAGSMSMKRPPQRSI